MALIIQDVFTHAATRKLEWLMSAMFVHMGYVLALPDETFKGKTFQVIVQVIPEGYVAAVFGGFGLFRLGVLILNGTHIKQSSELRAILSAFSFIILFAWAWGIDATGVLTVSGVVYKWLAFGELMNVWQASSDMYKKRTYRKNGKSGSPSPRA